MSAQEVQHVLSMTINNRILTSFGLKVRLVSRTYILALRLACLRVWQAALPRSDGLEVTSITSGSCSSGVRRS